MKKQLSLLIFLLTASSFIFYSCSNKDTTPPPPKTKTQLLAQGIWKFKSAIVGAADYSSSLQACQKDNVLTFATAGTGIVDEGLTKCNGADLQTTSFTWNFLASETMLHITATLFSGGSGDFTLVSLTETELVVSQPFTIGPAVLIVVVTFIH